MDFLQGASLFDLAIIRFCDMVPGMPRQRKPHPHSRGWLLLRDILAAGKRNQKELAVVTKIPQSVISDLLNLWKLPNRIHGLALLRKLGIPVDAWDEPLSKSELRRLGIEVGKAA